MQRGKSASVHEKKGSFTIFQSAKIAPSRIACESSSILLELRVSAREYRVPFSFSLSLPLPSLLLGDCTPYTAVQRTYVAAVESRPLERGRKAPQSLVSPRLTSVSQGLVQVMLIVLWASAAGAGSTTSPFQICHHHHHHGQAAASSTATKG